MQDLAKGHHTRLIPVCVAFFWSRAWSSKGWHSQSQASSHHAGKSQYELCRSAAFQYLSPVFSLVDLARNYIDHSFGRWPEKTAKMDLLRRSSPEHFVPGAHLEAGGGRPVPSLGPSRPSSLGSWGGGMVHEKQSFLTYC